MPSSSLFLRSSTTLVSIASLFTSVLAVPAIAPRQETTPAYHLAKTYQGSSFFDDFSFFSGSDPTHGFVTYGDRNYANTNGLIGFEGDYAVMKIDSKTNLGKGSNYYANNGNGDYFDKNNVGRKSVRIEGTYQFTHGLIITDVGDMPSGVCGTWPAFWTLGQAAWPKDGEIDIIEGAHKQGGFWSALHTEGQSNINNNRDAMTGRISSTDCQVRLELGASANFEGCKIADPDSSTWDNYGGGVWATQWTSERIKIWYWPYGRVPADVTNGNPVPGSSAWGTPRASVSHRLFSFNVDRLLIDVRSMLHHRTSTLMPTSATTTSSSTPPSAVISVTLPGPRLVARAAPVSSRALIMSLTSLRPLPTRSGRSSMSRSSRRARQSLPPLLSDHPPPRPALPPLLAA